MKIFEKLKRFSVVVELALRLRGAGGFNIMDVTAALAITATLAAVVIPSVKGSIDNARVNSLMQEVTNIRNGLLKFNSDTNQMPSLVGVTDPTVNPEIGINGTLGTSGLRVNLKTATRTGSSFGIETDGEGLALWQGPYLDKDVGKNPFGGLYGLTYEDTASFVRDPSTGLTATRDSAILFVTGLPPAASDKVDTTLDDGNPAKGIVQTFDSDSDGIDDTLAVVILPLAQFSETSGLMR